VWAIACLIAAHELQRRGTIERDLESES
jgi:hypothetical protein